MGLDIVEKRGKRLEGGCNSAFLFAWSLGCIWVVVDFGLHKGPASSGRRILYHLHTLSQCMVNLTSTNSSSYDQN